MTLELPPPVRPANAQTWLDDTINEWARLDATDLHIRSDGPGQELQIRARVDGRLRHAPPLEAEVSQLVLGLIKNRARFSTVGSQLPEGGSFTANIDGQAWKVRAQLFQSFDGGQSIRIRIPHIGPLRTLEELSFDATNARHMRDLIQSPNGMTIIAGPMSEGKTTTAHALLNELDTPHSSIITVEEPVERTMPNMLQLEVDERAGVTFAALLPDLVRGDYDTLFLGEIRDRESAAAGIRQAKVGRRILTTMHGKNNVTALLRLMELAEDTPLSVLDAVQGVISQRLVPRLCIACLGIGCDACGQSGYRGRLPIHELLVVTPELSEALMTNQPLSHVYGLAEETALSTFRNDAKRLVDAGLTTWDAVTPIIGKGRLGNHS